jgi:hypothetical protein
MLRWILPRISQIIRKCLKRLIHLVFLSLVRVSLFYLLLPSVLPFNIPSILPSILTFILPDFFVKVAILESKLTRRILPIRINIHRGWKQRFRPARRTYRTIDQFLQEIIIGRYFEGYPTISIPTLQFGTVQACL